MTSKYRHYKPVTPVFGVTHAKQFGPLVILYYDDGSHVSMASGGLTISDSTIERFAVYACKHGEACNV